MVVETSCSASLWFADFAWTAPGGRGRARVEALVDGRTGNSQLLLVQGILPGKGRLAFIEQILNLVVLFGQCRRLRVSNTTTKKGSIGRIIA